MVHVWIAPHECGPFAALEGHGAGQASVSDGARMDQCDHDHGAGPRHTGHEPRDQAVRPRAPDRPRWRRRASRRSSRPTPRTSSPPPSAICRSGPTSTPSTAAGFQSIGDGATGHEHYIQWDWIDDDVILDPDYPESLVFEPQPDGSQAARVGDVHAAERHPARRRARLRRRTHAVARARRPLLHRRPGRPAGRRRQADRHAVLAAARRPARWRR